MPAPSRKNSRRSGKNRLNLREIHLLFILFDLREVGVERGVRHQAVLERVPGVDARLRVRVVRVRRRGFEIGLHRAQRVGLQLEAERGLRRLQAHQRGRLRHVHHRALRERGRHGREVGEFVLAARHAPELHAPVLRPRCRVAERPEGDDELHGPALFEPPGTRVPDGVPVAVGVAFVRDEAVAHPAERRSTGTGPRCADRGTCRRARRSCRSGSSRTSRGASRWPRCETGRSTSSAPRHRRSCRRRAARRPSSASPAGPRGAPAAGIRRWAGYGRRDLRRAVPSSVIGFRDARGAHRDASGAVAGDGGGGCRKHIGPRR